MTIFLSSSFGLGSNAVIILILENIGIIVQYPIRYVCKHHVGNEQRTPSLPRRFIWRTESPLMMKTMVIPISIGGGGGGE